MKAFFSKVLAKFWWFITTCLGEDGSISFGRFISFLLVFYFSAQDAWFFHRTGHLVDNATLLTQLTVMTAFYVTNKGTRMLSDMKNGNGAQPPQPPTT